MDSPLADTHHNIVVSAINARRVSMLGSVIDSSIHTQM